MSETVAGGLYVLAGIFDQTRISWGHVVDEWSNRRGRDDGIGGIANREHRTVEELRSNDIIVDPKGSGAEPVFAIVPPRECPITNGLAPPASDKTVATAWPIDRTV